MFGKLGASHHYLPTRAFEEDCLACYSKQVDVNQSAHLKFDNFDNEGQLLCVHHDMMVACLN